MQRVQLDKTVEELFRSKEPVEIAGRYGRFLAVQNPWSEPVEVEVNGRVAAVLNSPKDILVTSAPFFKGSSFESFSIDDWFALSEDLALPTLDSNVIFEQVEEIQDSSSLSESFESDLVISSEYGFENEPPISLAYVSFEKTPEEEHQSTIVDDGNKWLFSVGVVLLIFGFIAISTLPFMSIILGFTVSNKAEKIGNTTFVAIGRILGFLGVLASVFYAIFVFSFFASF